MLRKGEETNGWRYECDEVFEVEFYKTCCEFDTCPCYETFKRNVRAQTAEVLFRHDIRTQKILDEICEAAEMRREIMNSMEI